MNIRMLGVLHGILVIGMLGEELIHRSVPSEEDERRPRAYGIRVFLAGCLLAVVGYLGLFFGRLVRAAISRQREYLADATAVSITRDREGLAGAMKKVGGTSRGSRLRAPHAEESSHMYFASGIELFVFARARNPPAARRPDAPARPLVRGDLPPGAATRAAAPGPRPPPALPGPRPVRPGIRRRSRGCPLHGTRRARAIPPRVHPLDAASGGAHARGRGGARLRDRTRKGRSTLGRRAHRSDRRAGRFDRAAARRGGRARSRPPAARAPGASLRARGGATPAPGAHRGGRPSRRALRVRCGARRARAARAAVPVARASLVGAPARRRHRARALDARAPRALRCRARATPTSRARASSRNSSAGSR